MIATIYDKLLVIMGIENSFIMLRHTYIDLTTISCYYTIEFVLHCLYNYIEGSLNC